MGGLNEVEWELQGLEVTDERRVEKDMMSGGCWLEETEKGSGLGMVEVGRNGEGGMPEN